MKSPQEMTREELLDELERLQKDNFSLAAGQCIFPNGDGLVGDDYGHSVCLKDKRAEAAKAKVEALSEALGPALDRLQLFLDTHGDMGENYETQADINDWLEALATINPSREGE